MFCSNLTILLMVAVLSYWESVVVVFSVVFLLADLVSLLFLSAILFRFISNIVLVDWGIFCHSSG